MRTSKVSAKLFHLRHWNKEATTQAWQDIFHQIIGLLGSGSMTFRKPAASYPLSAVHEAVSAAESGKGAKIFLTNG
ncbi:hypothetical protein D3C73_1618250 [compost metagenome]